jgi:gamma-glutamylcyclotransferase (GGCT)/AIG2-like uncharacterized protein YtfP
MPKRGMSKEDIYAKLDKNLKTQEGKLNYLNTLAKHIGKTDPLTQQSFFEVTAEVSEEMGSKGKKPELLLESAKAYERLGQKDRVNQIRLKAAELFVQKAETEASLYSFDEATKLFGELGEKEKKRDAIFRKGKMMMGLARVNPFLSERQRRFSESQATDLFSQAADLFKSIGAYEEEQKAAISNIYSSLSQRGSERTFTEGYGRSIISFLRSHGVKDKEIGDVVEKGGWQVFSLWDHSPFTGGHGWNPYILQGAARALQELGLNEQANELGKKTARYFLNRGVIDTALMEFESSGDKAGIREAAIAMLGGWDLKIQHRRVDMPEFMKTYGLNKDDVVNVAKILMRSACQGESKDPNDSRSYSRLAELRLRAVLNEDEVDKVLGELYEQNGQISPAIDCLSKSPKTRPRAIELARQYANREIKREDARGYKNVISAFESVGLDKDGAPEDIELLADAYERLGQKDGTKKAIALRRKLKK